MLKQRDARRAFAGLIFLALVVGLRVWGPTPPAANAGRDEVAAALQAALDALNGVPAALCSANGQVPPPGRDTCVSAVPGQAEQADRGLLAVQAFLSPDIQPVFALVGRGADGAWGLWLAGPAAYVPVQLPAEARACAAGGLAVRSSPSADAAVRGSLPADSLVTVDRFVLDQAGTWSRDEGGRRGEGWYHLAGPLEGWAAAQWLVVADGDCAMALP